MQEKIENLINQIVSLQKQINQWNKEYFDDDNPSVSDRVYDLAIIELKKYEDEIEHFLNFLAKRKRALAKKSQKNFLLDFEDVEYSWFDQLQEEKVNKLLADSPTKKVGAIIDNRFAKVVHKTPMISLNKAYSFEELKKFSDKIANLTTDFDFVVEPKIDGLSISIHYDQGKIQQAVTRGDGITGEDVTANVLKISSIPHNINFFEPLEVRGEIYLTKSKFQQLNELQKQMNESLFLNPRNVASGTIRQKDTNIVAKRQLDSFIYQIVSPHLYNIDTHDQTLAFLKQLGFCTNSYSKHVDNIEKAFEYIQEFEHQMPNLDYEMDGIVVKLNQYQYYQILGQTSKFPHSAIAFKYHDDLVTTKLIGIKPTVGRTGIITYNAVLEKVEINQTNVVAATLHNYNYIQSLKLSIGDLVLVKKSGDIIPKVIGTLAKRSATTYQKITHCPSCNSELVDSETGIDQFCENANCLEINIQKTIHFVSKKAMNIDGLAERTIRTFFEKGIIKNFIDVYFLDDKKDEVAKVFKKYGQGKAFDNLFKSIDKSKTTQLYRIIFALGINEIGEKKSKILAKIIDYDLNKLLSYDFEQLHDFHDFGPKIISSLKQWFANEDNRALISNFFNNPTNNFTIIDNVEFNSNNKFANLTFVITGTLSKPRNAFIDIIENLGGNVTSTISPKTNYLLAGEKAGSKLEKAKKLNIEIISEEDFFKLIEI